MIKVCIDNREIEAKEGSILLQVCLDNAIYIPSLCFVRGMTVPPASCRLCFVNIEGEKKPVNSCTVEVREGLIIRTDTPAVRKLQKAAFEYLMSVHHIDPKCPSKKTCELIKIAKYLKTGLKPRRLERILRQKDIDTIHPFFNLYPNRCVLCGKCTYICQKIHGKSFLTFAKRGFDTVISFYGIRDESLMNCKNCLACVRICPVGAILKKSENEQLCYESAS